MLRRSVRTVRPDLMETKRQNILSGIGRLRCAATMREGLKAIFRSGLSARQIVLTICVGSAIGVLPVVWGSTLICFLLAFLFRLKHAAVQAVNFLMYPVQFALFVPFYCLGKRLVPWGPAMSSQSLSLDRLISTESLGTGMWLMGKALLGWLVTVPPVAVVFYLLACLWLRKGSSLVFFRKDRNATVASR